MAALSGGHLLIEDVPGVGKTVLARALAASLGAELSRVQGHPDLLPSDVTGVSVFAPDTGTWEFRPGPVFAHVVLVDELNRTPPRTQAALLETMEEQQVSVDGESWPLPRPHLVIATQNPFSQLGTYPLVESQLDRFALATAIGYPDSDTEARLVQHGGGKFALGELRPVCNTQEWLGAQRATESVDVATERGRVRGGAVPGQSRRPGRAAGRQPPRRHLAHPGRPGPRRAVDEIVRHARRREGGRGGVSGAPAPHRRRCRAGCRRGPGPARHHTCSPAVTGRADRERPVGTTARRRRFVRPVRPVVPLVSCAGVLLAWGLVAHNSGAGWVQAVGDVLAGILAVGLVAPAVVGGAGAACAIVEVPSDATAGLPVELPVDGRPPGFGSGPSTRPGPRPSWARHWRRRGARPRRPVPDASPARSRCSPRAAACTTASCSRSPRLLPSACCGGARPSSWRSPARCMSGPAWAVPCALPGGDEDTSGGGVLDSSVPDRRAPRGAPLPARATTAGGCTGPPPPTAGS